MSEPIPEPSSEYQHLLEQEAQVWGNQAQADAQTIQPDWEYVQRRPHQVVYAGRKIRKLLALVQPGWRVLELGCSSGWLSLEMARRGAEVEGVDVAEAAIRIAQDYAAAHPPQGSVSYRAADINHLALEPGSYDLIVAIGTLHHLVEVESVMTRIHAALKPGGTFYLAEPLDTPRLNALVSGALMMLLPTQLSYREKLGHLLRVRGEALNRMKDSIEAKGLSPFEGYGRHADPLALARDRFAIREYEEMSAFTGYVMAQLKLPDTWTIRVGRGLYAVDRALVRLRLMRGLMFSIYAGRKS
jgi:2-polyprenyl-3-methyl-5-hydroxy-6-metoxy-1,4-benzoquinol methylase